MEPLEIGLICGGVWIFVLLVVYICVAVCIHNVDDDIRRLGRRNSTANTAELPKRTWAEAIALCCIHSLLFLLFVPCATIGIACLPILAVGFVVVECLKLVLCCRSERERVAQPVVQVQVQVNCSSCSNSCNASSAVKCSQCQAMTCPQCFAMHVDALLESTTAPITCKSCAARVSMDILKEFLSQAALRRYMSSTK